MIFVYTLCLLLFVTLIILVISPYLLIKDSNSDSVADGFFSEKEYLETLNLRDSLIKELLGKETNHPLVTGQSKELCFEALLTICLRLKKAGFTLLPDPKSLLLFLLCLLPKLPTDFSLNVAPSLSNDALAQSTSAGADAHSQAKLPGLIDVANSRFATIHQYILSPRQGELGVYYLTFFDNPNPGSDLELSLPFPDGVTQLSFENTEILLVPKDASVTWTRILIPKSPEKIEIRAEFTLNGTFGSVAWQNEESKIPALPGTMLFLMPKLNGILRNIMESIGLNPNIWPARIHNFGADFKSGETPERLNPKDPNYDLLKRIPPQLTFYYVRESSSPANFPTFDVIGVVPSRLPLYLAALLFASLLAGFAIFATTKNLSPKTARL